MSRNMILANQSFFANIIGALNNVQAEYIEKCKIIKKFSQSSTALKLLEESAMKESVPKFIYAVRNGIVHETREPLIPLGNNERWEKLIAGMLLLIKES